MRGSSARLLSVSRNQSGVVSDIGSTAGIESGGTNVDLFCDFENGSDETIFTTTILNNGTHGSGGTWNIVIPNPLVNTKVDTGGEKSLNGKRFKAGGTTYDDASATRGYRLNLINGGEYSRGQLTTSKSVVSYGFFFYTDIPYQDYNSYSFAGLFSFTETRFVAFNILNNLAASFRVRIETDGGTTNGTTITRNTWYWVSLKYDSAGPTGYLSIYNPSTWTEVGTTVSMAMGGSSNCSLWKIGKTGGSTVTASYNIWFDDVAIDFTNYAFPLLPT